MGLRLGCGVITCQRIAGSGRPFEDIYADELAYAVAAEEVGFDSVWLSEHHFTEDGYLSAIFPMMAAIAARTSRVDLGTDVILSPLHHPLRFAEDAAAVAVLAGAQRQLKLGLAIGYRDEEFAPWGEQLLDRVGSLASAFAQDRLFELGVRLYYPAMERAEVLDAMARFATEVMPGLRAVAG